MTGLRRVTLGYGRAPLEVSVPDDAAVVRTPSAKARPRRPPADCCAEALARPIGAPRLRGRVAAGARVTVIVSDGSRHEPRAEMLRAVLEEIAVPVRLRVAVANGTHAPGPREVLGLELPPGAALYDHVAVDDAAFVDVGTTRRGTRIRLPRVLLDSDLVVATGRIRPHYFAGFGAGAKAIFPGLGHNDDIRANHRLKGDPSARLGRVDGNVCREDMEEAAGMLPVDSHLLNVVMDDAEQTVAAVAGDLVAAHRVGVAACRPLCEAQAAPADVVVTSERLPLSGSLYQASKLLAPAAAWLRPGGVAVLAAECPFGTGPVQVVNEAIYRTGIAKLLPQHHIIYLVSSLPPERVAETYCRYAPSVEWVLERHPGRVLVLPEAGNLVPCIESSSSD